MYVRDAGELKTLVDAVTGSPFIAVDTEFMRERTYYARLCLIQIATDDVCAIIDPLAFDDLQPLYELLSDPSVEKIMHAGSQDLEIFFQKMGSVPTPVFDTQIAATLAGFPQQVGYRALVMDLLGETIDKSDTFTDWARRPLSETQVAYALNDVLHLPEVYRKLKVSLEATGRIEWLSGDFARLTDPATYEVVPEEQWRRVKRYSSLNRRQLGVLIHVTAWREREAQQRDCPRKWIMGDESLIEVARRAPTTVEDLGQIRGVGDKVAGKRAASGILQAVHEGRAMAEEDLPRFERKRMAPIEGDGVVDVLAALVRLRAREHNVAVPLLASREDLERLIAGEREENELLQGWRRTLVGEELLELLDGQLGLRIKDGRVMVTPVVEEED